MSDVDSNELSLTKLAHNSLSELCAQDWIKQKFIFQPDLLTDKILMQKFKPDLPQRLLRNVVRRPSDTAFFQQSAPLMEKSMMDVSTRVKYVGVIIDTLDLWNIRASMLHLQLLLRQASPTVSDKAGFCLFCRSKTH